VFYPSIVQMFSGRAAGRMNYSALQNQSDLRNRITHPLAVCLQDKRGLSNVCSSTPKCRYKWFPFFSTLAFLPCAFFSVGFLSARFFPGHFGTCFSGFGKANGNSLLAACNFFTTAPAFKLAAFFFMHGAFYFFACFLRIFCHPLKGNMFSVHSYVGVLLKELLKRWLSAFQQL
jgi:hypothetical protein